MRVDFSSECITGVLVSSINGFYCCCCRRGPLHDHVQQLPSHSVVGEHTMLPTTDWFVRGTQPCAQPARRRCSNTFDVLLMIVSVAAGPVDWCRRHHSCVMSSLKLDLSVTSLCLKCSVSYRLVNPGGGSLPWVSGVIVHDARLLFEHH